MRKTRMWQWTAIVLLLAIFCMAAQDFRLITQRYVWQVAETCTSAGDEPTALGVAERTFKTVDAAITAASSGDDEIEFFMVPDGANGMRFTAIGITNDGTYTVDVYSGTLGTTVSRARGLGIDCNLTHIGELAFIIGQQVSSTANYKMAQSVTATAKDSVSNWGSSGTVDSDRTCEAAIDVQGADFIVTVPVTCSADSKLLIKGY